MNAQQNFNHFCQLDGVTIEEGEHAIDGSYDNVEFTYQEKELSASGSYGHSEGQANFSLAYQVQGEIFDIEHICEQGEESICFNSIEPYYAEASLKDGKINRITISERVNGIEFKLKWSLSAKNGQRFLTLD